MTEVYLNGKFVGSVENPTEFVDHIVTERRKGVLTSNLNILYNREQENIMMECGRGRLRRPLIVVKEGKPLLTEKQVAQLEKGEISWSDLETREYLNILMHLKKKIPMLHSPRMN